MMSMYLFSQVKSLRRLFSVLLFVATFCSSFNLVIASEEKVLLTDDSSTDKTPNKDKTQQQNIKCSKKLITNASNNINKKSVLEQERAKSNKSGKKKHKIEFDQTFIFKVILFLSALATFLKILENNRFKPQFRFNTYGEHGFVDTKGAVAKLRINSIFS